MARTLNSTEICSRALRMVGEFPMSETAPDGEMLREAMFWLDMILATTAGIKEVFHLVPATVTMTLTPGQKTYSLRTLMGAGYPSEGLSFPVGATIAFPNNSRLPIDIVQRRTIDGFGRPDDAGVPRALYIDRLASDQMVTIWPVLSASETQPYKIDLTFQKQSPDLSPSGVSGARPNDTRVTETRVAWQEWLVLRLAVRLGSGAINKLPDSSLSRWDKAATEIRMELDAFENREHDTTPPIAASYGIEDYEAEALGFDSMDSYTLPLGRYGRYGGFQ